MARPTRPSYSPPMTCDPLINVRASLVCRTRSDPAIVVENDDVRAPPLIEIPTHPLPLSSLVLSNPSSLIQSIERLMHVNVPFTFGRVRSVQAGGGNTVVVRPDTVERNGEGGMASSTTDDDDDNNGAKGICSLISLTDIPDLMVRFVDDSPRPIVEWTRDLTEDACLGAMCNMAMWRDSSEA
jgi:hypothetical protein